ncbi:unnamed protein product [Owenia fusiformis]|uniref:WW domain binding protein VOPP1 n=1 Tax=Owenia fusiformis TaxID=6347 RepID=A0A8S4P7Z6_OWEFU|nr:unnamed protein product [Owenia fusiformis]
MAIRLSHIAILVGIVCVNLTAAYYCDSGRCSEDEYCCGENKCCASFAVWQYWYFWCGLVFFIIMLTGCAGCCRYRYYQQIVVIQPGSGGTHPYTRLEHSNASVYSPTNVPDKYTNKSSHFGQEYTPPPPYSPNKPK